MIEKLEVGQKLYVFDNCHGQMKYARGFEVEVIKIGRKWVTVSGALILNSRFMLEIFMRRGTAYLDSDGCTPSRRVYLNESQYKAESEKNKLLTDVMRFFRDIKESDLPTEKLVDIADTLGIPHNILLVPGRERLRELADVAHRAAHAAGLSAGFDVTKLPEIVARFVDDKALLDSGCIMTDEFDDLGEGYQCHRNGLNLRRNIRAAMVANSLTSDKAKS